MAISSQGRTSRRLQRALASVTVMPARTRARPAAALTRREAWQAQRQIDVFSSRVRWDQRVTLEDVADLRATQGCACALTHPRDVFSVDEQLPCTRQIERPN
jgi:hypothetical protein